jgi:hypothetical protein
MSPIKLQTKEDGIAKLCPITEFEVRIATHEMVVLVIQYVENIEQFDSGQWKQLQAVLSAGRARAWCHPRKGSRSLFERGFLSSSPVEIVAHEAHLSRFRLSDQIRSSLLRQSSFVA